MNLFEFTQLFCPRCVETRSFRDYQQSTSTHHRCPVCTSDLEAIYKVNFIVKDKSLFKMQGGAKVVLFTSDGVCDKFFGGLPPQNMYRDPMFRQHIERYVRHLVRFNVFVDAIVERKVLGEEVVIKLISARLKPQ